MTALDRGFLLLTSHLGDPYRKPLTVAQFRELTNRVRSGAPAGEERQLVQDDLVALGYSRETAQRILRLLSDEELLEYYLHKAKWGGCQVLTRVSEGYPPLVRKRLGLDSPGCLWTKGDPAPLKKPKIALVGSRQLRPENREFALEVGRQAAKQGYVLVSGNARGADVTAQDACLAAGGQVICVVADALQGHREKEHVLYISEDGFDLEFSAQRALSRNRVIHTLGEKTFVAQCGLRTGGTWDGTARNLKGDWSGVFCFADGSAAADELALLGAALIRPEELTDIAKLQKEHTDFFDQ